jgi:hypothetical protein
LGVTFGKFALFICHKRGTFATIRSAKLMTARKREELLQSKEAELTVMQEQLETAKEELLRREAELDRRSSELAHVQVRLLVLQCSVFVRQNHEIFSWRNSTLYLKIH